MYTVPWLYTLSMIFLLIAQLPHLAFTRVSLDIFANISAVSTNSMDCLSKIVEMAWKAKNTDNTSHVEVVGTCCNIYQYNIKSIVSVCEGAMKKVHVVSLYNEQEKGSRFEQWARCCFSLLTQIPIKSTGRSTQSWIVVTWSFPLKRFDKLYFYLPFRHFKMK